MKNWTKVAAAGTLISFAVLAGSAGDADAKKKSRLDAPPPSIIRTESSLSTQEGPISSLHPPKRFDEGSSEGLFGWMFWIERVAMWGFEQAN